MSAIATASGAARDSSPSGPKRLVQDLVRAEHAEPLLGEHPDDSGQQSIVAGECRAADAGQNARALGIRPQIEQRRPPHRPDQHEVLAAMLAQARQ